MGNANKTKNNVEFEIETVIQGSPGAPLAIAYLEPSNGVEVDEFSIKPINPGKIQLTITHVTIVGDAAAADSTRSLDYVINDIEVQEEVDDGWETFSEFRYSKQYATDIGVVILLDTSASVKDQLGQNRKLAVRLAQELFRDEQAGSKTVVAVAPLTLGAGREVTFTNKLQEVELQTRKIQTYAYTPLFDGIAQAIDLFGTYEKSSQASSESSDRPFKFEEKFIVIISDGQDGSSLRETPITVATKLAESDIDVYALGIQGSDRIHQARLEGLTGTGRFINLSALSPQDALDRMAEVKDMILRSCRDRYDLYYQRSAIGTESSVKIRFILNAQPKNAIETQTGALR
jgi:uncharacterized protein YegL